MSFQTHPLHKCLTVCVTSFITFFSPFYHFVSKFSIICTYFLQQMGQQIIYGGRKTQFKSWIKYSWSLVPRLSTVLTTRPSTSQKGFESFKPWESPTTKKNGSDIFFWVFKLWVLILLFIIYFRLVLNLDHTLLCPVYSTGGKTLENSNHSQLPNLFIR